MQIKSFVYKLILFMACLFVTDRTLGWILGKIYFGQTKGQLAMTTYAVQKTHEDILILGSSRASRHYSPAILSAKTGLSVYNSGRDGEMVPYSDALLHVSLARYKPRVVILDIDPWSINLDGKKYDRLSVLLPYTSNPEVLKQLKQYDPWLPVKIASHVYRYNSSLFISLYNILKTNSLETDDRGFLPFHNVISEEAYADYVQRTAAERENWQVEYDKRALGLLEDFLRTSSAKKIKTFVVISPAIFKGFFNPRYVKLIRDLVARYPEVKYLDFSEKERYNSDHSLFGDPMHLNNRGAEVFSRELSDSVFRNL